MKLNQFESKLFERLEDGTEIILYTIRNTKGMEVALLNLGATLRNVIVPDKNGNSIDVVLGYDNTNDYLEKNTFFGATVGRNANRIGGASFILNGKKYNLDQNDGKNNLHSGLDFYKDRVWEVKETSENSITFTLFSPDGDQGFPGNLKIDVKYTLTAENELCISYIGTADEDTVINLTNHSYFNLEGHASGSVLNQEVWLNADAFTMADEESIPTGEITSVENTPMDFRVKKKLIEDFYADYEPLKFGSGYDHNWVLKDSDEMRKVAELSSETSGIIMEVHTDLPGMQMYTGNFIENEPGKNGVTYHKNQGVCFETQYFPDAVNKENFESPVLKAGDVYKTETIYKFKSSNESLQ